ncbi:MAG: MBL fold metallo-hydrolase [Haloarculaceae archaeon]
MPVELADGLWWIPQCEPVGDDDDRHVHASVYLLTGAGGNVLVDAGPPDAAHVREAVEDVTDGAGVDALVMTHTNLPHAGDVGAYEDARVYSATDIPPEFGGYGELWKIDETHDVCGREISFVKPPMTDHVYSQWPFDHDTGTLFTSEALGNYHRPGRCTEVWDAPERAVATEDVDAYCRDRLPWLQYARPESFRETLERRLGRFDVDRVAPSHGTPVTAAHLPAYVERLLTVTAGIADDWPLHRAEL